MSAGIEAGTPQGAATPVSSGFDPFRTIWGLLVNVKFALFLVTLGVVTGLIGTVVPQVPPGMRDDPVAHSAWMELRREDFGQLTGPFDNLGLFDVFHTPWFTVLWATIIVAVTVCTVSRLRPTWRNVAKPPALVPDTFFRSAPHRLTFPTDVGAGGVAEALRKRRYRVQEVQAHGESHYLFADRIPWAQYGTFVSHLALLVLLIGALFTVFGGFSRRMVITETSPAAPVFAQPGPGQIFVEVIDAFRGIDADGNIVDFHTNVVIRRGKESTSCRVTVNGPCEAFGYRVHQAAFFDDFARLRMTDADGAILFDGVLDFEGQTTTVPRLQVISPSGETLADEAMPQLATDAGSSPAREDDVALGALSIAASGDDPGLALGLSWRAGPDVFQLAIGSGSELRQFRVGDFWELDGYRIEFVGPVLIPAVQVREFPAEADVVTFQMIQRFDGSRYLVGSGLADSSVALVEGVPRQLPDGAEVLFVEPVEGAGLDVRRDPGDTFIWIGIVMGMLGLAVTFYLPRRRLWARIGPDQVTLAGVAERTTRIDRELLRIAQSLAPRDATVGGSGIANEQRR